jgi:hypothetical protein
MAVQTVPVNSGISESSTSLFGLPSPTAAFNAGWSIVDQAWSIIDQLRKVTQLSRVQPWFCSATDLFPGLSTDYASPSARGCISAEVSNHCQVLVNY